MAQAFPSIPQEFVLADCRALVFHLNRDSVKPEWKSVGENAVYSTVKLVHQVEHQGRIFRILGRLETSGSTTLDVILQPTVDYNVQEPTWHLLTVNRQNIYGLFLSPESDGGKFSIVVQNSLKSLQSVPVSNYPAPPVPREAWAPVKSTATPPASQQGWLNQTSPISPALGNFVYQFETSKQQPVTPMASSQTMAASSPILSSPRTQVLPPRSPASSRRTEEEDTIDSLCDTLSEAISRGNITQATELVRTMATKKLSLNIMHKPSTPMAVDGGKSDVIKLRVVVEDSETSGGAFHLNVSLKTKIEKLQKEVEEKYGFPPKVQRWIIGQKMAQPEDSLFHLGVKQTGFTAYLYLIAGRSVGLTREDVEKLRQYKPQIGQSNDAVPNGVARHSSLGQEPPVSVAASATLGPGMAEAGLQRASSMPLLSSNQESAGNTTEGVTGSRNAPLPAASTSQQEVRMPLPQATQVRTPVPQATQIRQPAPQETFGFAAMSQGIRPANPQPVAEEPLLTGLRRPAQSINDLRALFHQNQGFDLGLNPEPQSHPVENTEVAQGWGCPKCTFMNTPTRPGCEICGFARPEDYVVPQNSPLDQQEKERLEREALQTQLFFEVEEEQGREGLARLLREGMEAEERQRVQNAQQRQQNLNALLQTAQQNLILNQEEFECAICFTEIDPGEGVVLRECLHRFCTECLREHIRNSNDPEVQCPYQDNEFACHFVITAQEIKALLPEEDFNKFLNRSLATAESQASNSFHCKTPNCPGWCIYEDNVNLFPCPVCSKVNCLTCKAIHHPEMDCKEYQDDLQRRAQNDVAARQTQAFLEEMIEKGDAMKCPQCHIIVLKKDGCDWMRCTMCRLEICWATRGPRWGPQGTGDLSGGCKCRVGGKKCHPQCRNCH